MRHLINRRRARRQAHALTIARAARDTAREALDYTNTVLDRIAPQEAAQ